jgi:1-acyl-sn-glycerol-3-phosphate acyltransferase
MTDAGVAARAEPGVPLLIRIAAALARFALSSLARVRVEFDGELPHEGPLIVVANHLSNADPPLVAGWLTPKLGRKLNILAKESLFVGPIGSMLRRLGATPVRSGGSDIEAYRMARGVLDRGEVLCIFPEGTRSRDGLLGEPKPGVAMLATRSGVPVLPVGVSGTDRFLGRGARFPRIGSRITLRVGRTFTVSLESGVSRREAMDRASNEIMGQIARLVDERHRGRYASPGEMTDASPI